MKRIFALLIVVSLAISLMGCSKPDSLLGGMLDTIKNGNLSSASGSAEAEKIHFQDDQPLFIAQNRLDNNSDGGISCHYNHNGTLLYTYEDTEVGFYAENGLALALDPATNRYGYVDKSGAFVIAPQYFAASPFSPNGLAAVSYTQVGDNCTSGFIDSTGKEVIPCTYAAVSSFYLSGYASFSHIPQYDSNGNYNTPLFGIMDEQGNVVIEPKYEAIYWIYDDYFIARLDYSSYSVVVDFSGNIIAELDYTADAGTNICFLCRSDRLLRITYDYNEIIRKTECFNGKTFENINKEYEICTKRSVNSSTGTAYGVEANGTTVVPYEYDAIVADGSYLLAFEYANSSDAYVCDIYDQNFKKTADNIPYIFSSMTVKYIYSPHRINLPDGYFVILNKVIENKHSGYGIVDYQGNVIVEPVFQSVTLCTYLGTAAFPHLS